MALSISPEKGLFVKKTVYVDMDGKPIRIILRMPPAYSP